MTPRQKTTFFEVVGRQLLHFIGIFWPFGYGCGCGSYLVAAVAVLPLPMCCRCCCCCCCCCCSCCCSIHTLFIVHSCTINACNLPQLKDDPYAKIHPIQSIYFDLANVFKYTSSSLVNTSKEKVIHPRLYDYLND